MPFDFNKLMADPTFQFGASLFGDSSSNAVPAAFAALQQMEQQKRQAAYQQQKLEEEIAQNEVTRRYQEAQTANAERQRAFELQREERLERQQAAEEQRAIETQRRNDEFMEKAMGSGIFGPQLPKPETAPAQGASDRGKFGTPANILDNLEQVESSGNARAIGPAIPGRKERAQGAYQFLPSTAAEIGEQMGQKFDPFNKAQARDAADFYLAKLAEQNGGDYAKALAAYGGFKKEDPTAYVSKVMGGTQPATPKNAGMNAARLGALGALMGQKGGTQLLELGKMENETQYKERDFDLRERALANETSKTGMTLEKGQQEVRATRASAEAEVRGITSNFNRLETNADTLLSHPGLPQITGLTGLSGAYNLTEKGRDANVLLQGLKDKIVVDTMRDLKMSSANGSSGFGPLSTKEGERLEGYISNLSRAQSLPQMKKALADIKTFAATAKKNYARKFSETYPKQPVGKSKFLGFE